MTSNYYRASPAAHEQYYFESASPTPSPRHHRESRDFYDMGDRLYDMPERPATRATHSRRKSSSSSFMHATPPARPPTAHPTAAASPRYNSSGQYATVNVSESGPSRRYSSSGTRTKGERRSSQSYHRTSERRGDSDEDEWFEDNGAYYVLPAQSRSKRWSGMGTKEYYTRDGLETDYHYYYAQAPSRDAYQSSPMSPEPRRSSHSRRPSVSTPQRPQTTVPSSSHKHKRSSSKQHESSFQRPQAPPPQPEHSHRKATQDDAKKFQIPEGYSLSHWDPQETPIILAGSVFDANSLGKWIYDWVAHVYSGPEGREMVGIAGELWLLLIQISGKIKRAGEVMPEIRTLENREMVDDFIESGERLNDKLRRLLKRCEGPMLDVRSSKSGKNKLGTTAGVRFVHTLLGRDYELANTEKFMASVHLWNLRFDANCEEILLNPTK